MSSAAGRTLPGWLGVSLIALGLVVNEWTVGLAAPDGVVTGEYKLFVIVFCQVFSVLSGIAVLSKRFRIEPRPLAAYGASIAAASLLVASASWGLRAYTSRHNHTVHAGHEAVPTPEEKAWADSFYYRSLESAKRNGWFDYEKARQDGFEKMWKDRAHYQNETFLFDDAILDPDRPEFLMYLDAPEGKLLIGFMYYARTLEEKGPELGGPLARWHFHPWEPRGLCAIRGILPVGRPDDQGRCAEGERVMRSPDMLHVYFVDHPLGRFADGMIFPEEKSLSDPTLFHPFFVHFTVALFTIAVLLDVLAKALGKPAWHSAAWINLALTGVFAVATVVAGMVAEVNLLIGPVVHQTLTTHKQLGFVLLGAIVVLVGWRAALKGRFPVKGGLLYLVLAIGSAGLTWAAGYYGAQLVYVEGVAVQAIDRHALENHRYRVFNIYRREGAPPEQTGGWVPETTQELPAPPSHHGAHP
jgi:uncharacterized membrane protein